MQKKKKNISPSTSTIDFLHPPSVEISSNSKLKQKEKNVHNFIFMSSYDFTYLVVTVLKSQVMEEIRA